MLLYLILNLTKDILKSRVSLTLSNLLTHSGKSKKTNLCGRHHSFVACHKNMHLRICGMTIYLDYQVTFRQSERKGSYSCNYNRSVLSWIQWQKGRIELQNGVLISTQMLGKKAWPFTLLDWLYRFTLKKKKKKQLSFWVIYYKQ